MRSGSDLKERDYTRPKGSIAVEFERRGGATWFPYEDEGREKRTPKPYDGMIVLHKWSFVAFVEVKMRGNKLTKEQDAFAAECERKQIEHFVLRIYRDKFALCSYLNGRERSIGAGATLGAALGLIVDLMLKIEIAV